MISLKQKTKNSLILTTLIVSVFSFEAAPANAAGIGSFICTGTIMNEIAGKILSKLGDKVTDVAESVTKVPVSDSTTHSKQTDTNSKLETANKYQDVIDCAQETLTNLNHDFTGNFVDSVLKNYTINDYLSYAKNLAYTVYVAGQLKNHDPEAEFIVRQNIQAMMGGNGNLDLDSLYKRRATISANFDPTKLVDGVTGSAFDSLDDPFTTTPMGQKLSFEMQSQQVLANAQNAASQNIANSQGKKDAFNCKADNSLGKTLCSVKYPAQYVTSQVDSGISTLLGEQVKPQRNVTALTNFIRNFAKLKTNNLINDIKGGKPADERPQFDN